MLLGKIVGKSSTNQFYFLVESGAKKFMYVKSFHKEGYDVLAQIVEIEKEKGVTRAKCNILGYKDGQGVLRNLRTPLEPDSSVEYADDGFVRNILGLESDKNGAFIGVLEDRPGIKVYLDLNKIITKHLAVLAKSGSGKSFFCGVLLEEILERKIPVVVIDPHGEYSSLKFPSDNRVLLKNFGLDPKSYIKQIQEYSPDIEKNPEAKILKLSANNLTGSELMHLLPAKLTSSQIGLLYGALMDVTRVSDFDQLMLGLQSEENNAKWSLISIIDYLKRLNIFSESATSINEIINIGKCSIINLRGIPQELQEIIVYKLVSDLFNARKQGIVPPFFLVIEESHNYAPERNYGEVKSSSILRQVTAEGRKFGLGVAVVSQRPARVEKTILSQCSTQVIFKITNPNDLKSISSSVEGITSETENEIVNLHVGTAMVIGVTDMPLFVDVRPRRTKHGGESIDVVGTFADAKLELTPTSFDSLISSGNINGTKEVMSMIKPKLTKNEIISLVNKKVNSLKAVLVPCHMFACIKDKSEFNILVNLNNGHVVTDLERGIGKSLILNLDKLSEKENRVLTTCKNLGKGITPADVFQNSGIMFSEAFDIMNNLVKKGFLISKDKIYSLSESLSALLNLNELACYEKNEFLPFEFDEKLEVKHKIGDISSILKKFVEIKNSKECNLVKYDIEY